jgi:hypothetical protein
VLESAAPRVGDDEELRRPATAAVAVGAGGARFDQAFAYQVVQVAPDGRGREAEPAAQRARGRRAKLQDQPGDLAAGAALGDRVTMLCALYAWYSAVGGRGIPGRARRPELFATPTERLRVNTGVT